MKERPLPFKAPMVRALLAGTKTQTRRIVKPPVGPHDVACLISTPDSRAAFIRHRCPHGGPGDRLWGKETYWVDKTTGAFKWYAHDGLINVDRERDHAKQRAGTFMPRSLSRILLEITGVRVERLQDISQEDCWAEGIEPNQTGHVAEEAALDRLDYANLWVRINGPGSWDANPWVWVIEFKMVSP